MNNGLARRGTSLAVRLVLLCLLLLNAGIFGGVAWLIAGESAGWIVGGIAALFTGLAFGLAAGARRQATD